MSHLKSGHMCLLTFAIWEIISRFDLQPQVLYNVCKTRYIFVCAFPYWLLVPKFAYKFLFLAFYGTQGAQKDEEFRIWLEYDDHGKEGHIFISIRQRVEKSLKCVKTDTKVLVIFLQNWIIGIVIWTFWRYFWAYNYSLMDVDIGVISVEIIGFILWREIKCYFVRVYQCTKSALKFCYIKNMKKNTKKNREEERDTV